MSDVTFAPLLPPVVLILIATVGLAVFLARVRNALSGSVLRIAALSVALLFLAGPELRKTEGEIVPDVAIVLEDASRSLDFGARRAITEDASQRLTDRLDAEGLDVRRQRFGDRVETNLEAAITQSLANVPRRRLGGIFVVSDGQVHGRLEAVSRSLDIPVHGMITGDPEEERDRRVEVVSAPRFGVVGEVVEVRFRVTAINETGEIPAALYVDGELYAEQSLPIGEEITLTVPLTKPGDRLLELRVDKAEDELTPLNNQAVASLTAVRDRLRVLLVSGEPHAGERVWRNILKSDPAVDLVHFTILKPADKAANVAEEELNLITFPHVELFLEKLRDFDVLIFDRYTYRGVLESFEFEQIARYVERGGAVLIASGPEFADRGSLAGRPNLSYILPVQPTGPAEEQAFVPQRTQTGARHPVARQLGDAVDWGRWLRVVPGEVRDGNVLLTAGQRDRPLLVVDRVGDGRIAVLMSDHVWLWARGFDGGGPHRELLRRLVHWLMQEPELEEEALDGAVSTDGILAITRQSLAEAVLPIAVTRPGGEVEKVLVTETSPGQFTAQVPAEEPGLYRLETQTAEGRTLFALAASQEAILPELDAVATTAEMLAPIAEASGGAIYMIPREGAPLPTIRRVADNRQTAGTRWAGVVRRDVKEVEAVRIAALIPSWLALLLVGTAILFAWILEGGLLKRPFKE